MSSEPYVHKHFPRAMYHVSHQPIVVTDPKDQAERAPESDGWRETPAEAEAAAPAPEEASESPDSLMADARAMYQDAKHAADDLIASAKREASNIIENAVKDAQAEVAKVMEAATAPAPVATSADAKKR